MGAPAEATDRLRRQIDGILLRGEIEVSRLESEMGTSARGTGTAFDEQGMFDYLCHLMSLGALGTHFRPASPVGALACWLRLSTRGRALLERGEQSPHDRLRYLEAVKRRVRSADSIALTCLDEAVGAWEAGLNRSSAVMLGCACERLVLLLGEAIATVGIEPWSKRIAKKLSDGRVRISAFFDDVRQALKKLQEEKKLPRDLSDALDRKLSPVFDHARGLRNDCGHPTAAEVSAEEAEAGLLLFPGFYELCHQLIQHVRTLTGAACAP